ncbi:hypothetical protein [Facklamia hominis]|uniref:Uncharacterized protein n=1 Tax=Facklamia hominis TaxID=178214 RepID=A0AAJ1Q795_9LACT|nr:hypothetical protein [Facklamia hominis]MDK7187963.1 hypothetical protein [Facklamia hominis]
MHELTLINGHIYLDGKVLKGVNKYHIKNSANGKAELRVNMVVKLAKEDTSESKR